MCGQAEEFVATMSAQTMNEQWEINSHDSFAQKHAEPRLVLLSGRSQQRDQRRHTCRQRQWSKRLAFTVWNAVSRSKNSTFLRRCPDGVISLSLHFLARGHEDPIIEHHLPLCLNTNRLLCSAYSPAFHMQFNHAFDPHASLPMHFET